MHVKTAIKKINRMINAIKEINRLTALKQYNNGKALYTTDISSALV